MKQEIKHVRPNYLKYRNFKPFISPYTLNAFSYFKALHMLFPLMENVPFPSSSRELVIL